MSFLGGASGKEPTFRCRRRKRCGFDPLIPVGQEDFLAEGMATHSSTLAWRIPWAGEPGRLLSIESQNWTRLKQLSAYTNQILYMHYLS